ncbi:hypothetical protein AnigIFM50267_009655, partial [Aspergillus niger]
MSKFQNQEAQARDHVARGKLDEMCRRHNGGQRPTSEGQKQNANKCALKAGVQRRSSSRRVGM